MQTGNENEYFYLCLGGFFGGETQNPPPMRSTCVFLLIEPKRAVCIPFTSCLLRASHRMATISYMTINIESHVMYKLN